MSTPSCAAPLEFPRLLEYWLGELAPDEEQRLEEHVFACAHCAAGLEELAALAEGIRGAFRRGALHAVISPALLARMKREGLRLREYRVAPGERVPCTIAADDDFVVSRLAAPLGGVRRVDLVRQAAGGPQVRFADIPFDAEAGEVLFCPSAAALKKMPAHISHVRLVALGEGGETALGEYTFVHTPG